jgi:hypothetical protein
MAYYEDKGIFLYSHLEGGVWAQRLTVIFKQSSPNVKFLNDAPSLITQSLIFTSFLNVPVNSLYKVPSLL